MRLRNLYRPLGHEVLESRVCPAGWHVLCENVAGVGDEGQIWFRGDEFTQNKLGDIFVPDGETTIHWKEFGNPEDRDSNCTVPQFLLNQTIRVIITGLDQDDYVDLTTAFFGFKNQTVSSIRFDGGADNDTFYGPRDNLGALLVTMSAGLVQFNGGAGDDTFVEGPLGEKF